MNTFEVKTTHVDDVVERNPKLRWNQLEYGQVHELGVVLSGVPEDRAGFLSPVSISDKSFKSGRCLVQLAFLNPDDYTPGGQQLEATMEFGFLFPADDLGFVDKETKNIAVPLHGHLFRLPEDNFTLNFDSVEGEVSHGSPDRVVAVGPELPGQRGFFAGLARQAFQNFYMP